MICYPQSYTVPNSSILTINLFENLYYVLVSVQLKFYIIGRIEVRKTKNRSKWNSLGKSKRKRNTKEGPSF